MKELLHFVLVELLTVEGFRFPDELSGGVFPSNLLWSRDLEALDEVFLQGVLLWNLDFLGNFLFFGSRDGSSLFVGEDVGVGTHSEGVVLGLRRSVVALEWVFHGLFLFEHVVDGGLFLGKREGLWLKVGSLRRILNIRVLDERNLIFGIESLAGIGVVLGLLSIVLLQRSRLLNLATVINGGLMKRHLVRLVVLFIVERVE